MGSGLTASKYRYTGQLAQDVLGLDYYVARFYDPLLGHFTQADTFIPNPAKSISFDRYSYSSNNPINYNDPTGHWTEDELKDALGEEWEEEFFGKDRVFNKRENLLAFLKSKDTTDELTLGIIAGIFNTANYAHDLGVDFSNIDAFGARVSGSVGLGGYLDLSGDALLNLSSGEFSLFISGGGGLAIGETSTVVGGLTFITNLPSNNGYRGVSKSVGLNGGNIVGIDVERNMGGVKYFQDENDVFDGGFIGIGGATPSLALTGSLSYSIEALKMDQTGSKWWGYIPTFKEVLCDYGEVIQNDILHVP